MGKKIDLNAFLKECSFIDIHYHASPDLYFRRHNALDAGLHYKQLFGAVVLKSHLGSTAIQATLAQKMGLPVFPSITLNHSGGGISYQNVIHALSHYESDMPIKMIVDFPTITGRSINSRLKRTFVHPRYNHQNLKGETLFNQKHQLRKQVIDVLKMAKDYPIVLSTGHASKEEIFCLVDACIQYDVPALLLNQPSNPLSALSTDEIIALSQNEFLWVEQTLLTYLLKYQTKEDLLQLFNSIPRLIYSSDLGQETQMDIAEWYAFSKNLFHELDLSSAKQESILRANALKLLI